MKPYLLTGILLLLQVCSAAQQRYDIVITEIMADPTPPTGLPNQEWIELYNRSNLPIDLYQCRIADGTGQSGLLPAFVLAPDSFVIICGSGALPSLSAFGKTISVSSFPSLDNNGELVSILAPDGRVIHAVHYGLSWYNNPVKQNGGWSLEMIDRNAPCTGIANWTASKDPSGGTPGRSNSTTGTYPDPSPPQLTRVYSRDNHTIIVVFDEGLDSASVVNGQYHLSEGIGIISAIALPPLFNTIELKLNLALLPETIYTLRAAALTDCKGNSTTVEVRTGLTIDPIPVDIVINEILADPRPNGYDYIELYNRSNRTIDAARLFLANRDASGAIANPTRLSSEPCPLLPEEYLVLTEDPDDLARNYLVKDPARVLAVQNMPSYPDDAGSVILLDQQGNVIDEVNYREDWHFKLLANKEGISLERIDPGVGSTTGGNWHSAASSSGYGTPGYRNSQYLETGQGVAIIEVVPKIFSPDNDGRDDIARIQYRMNEPGNVANMTVFDAAGRPVKSLARNAILGLSGYWHWDGLDDSGKKLLAGIYIIFTEIFNLQGKKSRFRNTVVIATYLR